METVEFFIETPSHELPPQVLLKVFMANTGFGLKMQPVLFDARYPDVPLENQRLAGMLMVGALSEKVDLES